jgi:flagellar basal-body rod protein FlgB
MINGPSELSQLERYLKLATLREQAISSNMANVDTPGYRTKDLDFRSEMRKLSTATAPLNNVSTSGDEGSLLRPVEGLMERPDGNNVNLDRESMLMSETQLQYQMGIQLIKRQFHSLLSAINGGS